VLIILAGHVHAVYKTYEFRDLWLVQPQSTLGEERKQSIRLYTDDILNTAICYCSNDTHACRKQETYGKKIDKHSRQQNRKNVEFELELTTGRVTPNASIPFDLTGYCC
jgi:hypothetical protein